MDRNWNRGGSGGSGGSNGGEKMFRHSYSGGQNDFSGAEYYSKNVKPVLTHAQPVKKEALQVAMVENELMGGNFSWVKNGGSMCQ